MRTWAASFIELMPLFESKIKKTFRVLKYLLFTFVGVISAFAPFKGDSDSIFSGLSIDPLVAHADVPGSPSDGGCVGSTSPGSGEGSSASAGDGGDSGDSGGGDGSGGCAW